ncbi:MAG: hypothetical protein WD042_06770 [Phycisphaeraceae bacterium]
MPTQLHDLPLPYRRLERIGRRAWSQADRRLRDIHNARDLKAAQQDARTRFDRLFGPLPDRDARVDSRITAHFSYHDVAIQRIVLRSAYGYDIPAWSLRRADLRGKLPGVAVAAGHMELGSLAERYVKLALLLAMSGMHVVSFDPVGQGARREVFRPEDDPVYWDACKQHQHIAAATTLAGLSLPHFFVADGMTVVSHLCGDPGVDRGRIGFTGQSGGGIQTFYMIGADPRITAAVASQPTSTRRGAFAEVCGRDMCQMGLNHWTHAIDQHEEALLFAPRPLRIIAEYGYPDQLDVYQKLLPVYEAAGHGPELELVSGSVLHCMSRPCRELVLGWFNRYLQPDHPVALEPAWDGFASVHAAMLKAVEAENATNNGVIKYCQSLVDARRAKPVSPRDPRGAVRSNPFLRGVLRGQTFPILSATGRIVRRVAVGRYACALQDDYHVPFTVALGRRRGGTAVIVDEAGADSAWALHWARLMQGSVRRIVRMDVFACGQLATNLRPINDYHARTWRFYGGNQHAQDAFMAGRCPIGLAMEEVAAVVRSARLDDARLLLVGRGWPALALALLAGQWQSVIGCCMSAVPESYQMLLDAGYMHVGYSHLVPGLVTQTDWPELIHRHAATRYAICEPIRIGAATVAFDDSHRFPNVRLFDKDTAASRKKAAAFLVAP